MFFKNYFYNNAYQGDNNWDLLEEPASLKMDRYASTLINYKENKNIHEGKYHMKHEGILEVDENEENMSKNKINSTINDNEKEKENFLKKISLKRLNKILKTNDNNNFEQKQKMKDIANQFECFDLEPEENNDNLEKEQIKLLRQQFELGKKNKDIEKKIIHEEKQKLLTTQKLEEENMKKYAGKKINKDHNGEIIFIKSIKPDKLKLDFIFGKTKYKTINISSEKNNQQKKSEKKLTNKNVEKNDVITNNQEKENDNENSPRKGGKRFSIKSLPKLGSTKRRLSMHTIDNDDLASLKRRMPIITSGSNFEIMNMEVGVSIKEDEKYKTGGLDFLSKFKKFSLKAYDKKLREAEALNIYKKNIEIIEEPKTQAIDETNNYTLGYSTSYANNNFSSIQTESNHYTNKNIINQKMYSTNNSSMFNHYMRNTIKEKMKSNNSINPFIHLTTGGSSLLQTMDKLSLVENEEEKNHNKRKNIFRQTKKNFIKRSHKFILDDINLFTKNLVTNKRNEIKLNERMRTIEARRNPEKPNIREIIQEIGVKGKIMRNRSKLLAPIKSNYLDNENFFKH
jgi:hypothetical protein